MLKNKFTKIASFILAVMMLTGAVSAAVVPGFSDYVTSPKVEISETATEVKVTNAENGITLEIPMTSMPEGITSITLATNELPASNEIRTQSFEAISKAGGTPAGIIDLKLFDQSNKSIADFNGYITVTIPVPSGVTSIAYYDETTGEYKVLKASVAKGFLTFKTNHFSYYVLLKKAPAQPKITTVFKDTEKHWAKNSISFVSSIELFNGTGDGMFSPDLPMTRGMFVTVLGRYQGVNTKNTKTPFTDVAARKYYAPYVSWASDNGIINGTTKETFTPDRNNTHEEMIMILYRYATYLKEDVTVKGDLNKFSDSKTMSSVASDAYKWAIGAGIVTVEDNNGKLTPKANVTRAEVARAIERFYKLYNE